MTDRKPEIATIVVCEGDDATLDLLCDHLTADRFEVLPAHSAPDALRLCRYNGPDLLLLDVALPEASGLDLLRTIREADAEDSRLDPRLPVIVLTRRGGAAERAGSLYLDADDYVQKPFLYEELRARITAVLRRVEVSGREADRTSPDTSRPAVALITPVLHSRRLRICLGYWQPDGSWADADLGPGDVGLADAIREELAHSVCTVVCQSFTGEVTEPSHYNRLSPAEDGSLRLPRDPEIEQEDDRS